MHTSEKIWPSTGEGVSSPHSVLGSHLIKVLDVAKQAGVDVGACLDTVGLTRDGDSLRSLEVSTDVYSKLISTLVNNHDIPAFGFRVGREFSVVDYGALGYAVLTSRNLREALTVWCKYQHTVGSEELLQEDLHSEGDTARISLSSRQIDPQRYRFEIEQAIGQWSVAGTIQKIEPMFTFAQVRCTFSEPAYAKELRETLNCPVRFNQPSNEIHFDAKELEKSFTLSSEAMASICEEQCRQVLARLDQANTLVEQVRRIIIDSPGNPPRLEEVASRLNMSARSLRRNLRAEDSSFQRIMNDVQMIMAGDYLRQTHLSVKEISYVLGYSEVPNFHRAFKKWYEKTPSEYRQTYL